MAFDATLLVLCSKKADVQTITNMTLAILNNSLRSFSLCIEKTVSLSEYVEHTKSSRITRSIRFIEKRQNTENKKSITIDDDPYEDGIFTSPSYGFVCCCEAETLQKERALVVWIAFAKRLIIRCPQVENIAFSIGKQLSLSTSHEIHVLHATSRSRSEDVYALFVNGRNMNPLSGKGALTTVKNTYHLDINALMDAVDRCLAIVFAPYDINDAKKQLEKQRARIEEFETKSSSMVFTDKQDGSNMTERFKAENKVLLDSLNIRYETLLTALKTDPNGIVVPFKLAAFTQAPLSRDEHVFGKVD